MVSSTPRPHFTPGKDPVPILQEAGWAPEPVWKEGKSRPHRDSIPDRPARSQSLYRLSQYSMGIGVISQGLKRPGCKPDHSFLPVQRLRPTVGIYFQPHISYFIPCNGKIYLYLHSVQREQSLIACNGKFFFKFLFDSIKPDFQYGYGHGRPTARKKILSVHLKALFFDRTDPWTLSLV